jgi:hypothetical protein
MTYPPSLARADHLLTADELRTKYTTERDGGEHPQYSHHDWHQEVASRSTVRGYWDWVEAQLEADRYIKEDML